MGSPANFPSRLPPIVPNQVSKQGAKEESTQISKPKSTSIPSAQPIFKPEAKAQASKHHTAARTWTNLSPNAETSPLDHPEHDETYEGTALLSTTEAPLLEEQLEQDETIEGTALLSTMEKVIVDQTVNQKGSVLGDDILAQGYNPLNETAPFEKATIIADFQEEVNRLKKSMTLSARFWRWIKGEKSLFTPERILKISQLANDILVKHGGGNNSYFVQSMADFKKALPKLKFNVSPFTAENKMPKAVQGLLSPKLQELRVKKDSLNALKNDLLAIRAKLHSREQELAAVQPVDEHGNARVAEIKAQIDEQKLVNTQQLAKLNEIQEYEKVQRKVAKAELAITLGFGQIANKGTTGTMIITDINRKPIGIFKLSTKDVPLRIKFQNFVKSWGWGQLSLLSNKSMAQPQSELASYIVSLVGKFNLAAPANLATLANKHGVFQLFISKEKSGAIAQVKEANQLLAMPEAKAQAAAAKAQAPKYVEAVSVLSKLEGRDTFTEEEVTIFQKFAIFDYLIGNLDRHEENWFVILERNPHTHQDEIKFIKAIDNANAFPKKVPKPGSAAARQRCKWRQLKIANKPWTPAAQKFLQQDVLPTIKAMTDNIDGLMPDFFEGKMKRLFEARAKHLEQVVKVANEASPRMLAPFDNKAKNRALHDFLQTQKDFLKPGPLTRMASVISRLFTDAESVKKEAEKKQAMHTKLVEISKMLKIREEWIADLEIDEAVGPKQIAEYKRTIVELQEEIERLLPQYAS